MPLSFKKFLLELNLRADQPPIPAEKRARRRRYSHKFTADKIQHLDNRLSDGKPYWRKKSTGSIVFYGKQQKKRKYAKKPIN